MTIRAALLHELVPVDSVVTQVDLSEGISEIFDCHVQIDVPDPDLDLQAFLGSTALVQVFDEHQDPTDPAHARFIHGIVEEAEYLGPSSVGRSTHHAYGVRLRPSLNALAYRFRTRIFQNMSPIDAIKSIITDAGLAADGVEWSVASYTEREYVTQWKESELAFTRRWLEELGIRFFFVHAEDGHRMIVSDVPTQHEPIPGDPVLPVRWRDLDRDAEEQGLRHVTFEAMFRHDRWSARDWNWKTPDAPRDATAGEGGFELYEFPGGYPDDATGSWLSGVRAEELLVDQYVLRATTPCRRIVPGHTFELVDAAHPSAVGTYLITRAHHRFEGGDVGAWRTELEAIPAHVGYRPPRITPRPRVWGKESAVVTGPAGEEIHVDDMGRIKVHFYWDRENPVDDTASCWMRVQQLNTAGTLALPRVGWEVDVGFHYGDPDRPVVLQKVYNKEQMPPYALPANLMQSSLQTSSSPGGGGTNEIRMNDQAGGQEYFVHAQKDLAVTVGNNASETIAANSTVQVKSDYMHKVGGSETITIGGSQNISITGVLTSDTIASQTVTVGGVDDIGVGAIHTVTVEASRSDTISGLMNVLAAKVAHTFNASHSLSVGGALSFVAIGAIAETVAGAKDELVGGAKLEIISKSKAENIGVGKILNSGLVKITAGTDVNIAAEGALAIQTGGPLSSKCGGDFGISGSTVTFVIEGSLKMTAGGSIKATTGDIKLKGSSIGGKAADMLLKTGEVNYK
ncbi:MAG: type VI secretion system Vgr family protein [Sandaracinaceae bacterium]